MTSVYHEQVVREEYKGGEPKYWKTLVTNFYRLWITWRKIVCKLIIHHSIRRAVMFGKINL